MEPLAPHEKLFVDDEFFDDDEHAEIGCVTCHGGNPDDPDWKTAHKNVTRDPSYPEPDTCYDCHDQEASNYQQSLHVSNRPMGMMVLARTGDHPDIKAKVNAAEQKHCSQCHSSCGQCHVSRPTSVGGGLISGHLFKKSPPMQEVCIACHGSRIGNEYIGKDKNCKPDVHYEKARMTCEKCHTGDQMHGDGKEYAHRYDVENGPRCIHCHQDIYQEKGQNIETHITHKDKTSCQVCHSQAYTNCFNCHVATSKEGIEFYEVESHSMNFKIGINSRPSSMHPEKFVIVRHVPVDPNTFQYYVPNGLGRFDTQPTWKMATPHNIRRKTHQNNSCKNCHGNTKLFLLETNVRTGYLEANRPVMVLLNEIPPEQDRKTKIMALSER